MHGWSHTTELPGPDGLKNKQTSKPSTLCVYLSCVYVYECVHLCFPRPLPDVHLFNILHKWNTVNCPSGVRHERTRGPHISVSCCFCWVNLHPAEVEVLAIASYTSCDLQNFIKAAAAAQLPEQMCKVKITVYWTPAVLVLVNYHYTLKRQLQT